MSESKPSDKKKIIEERSWYSDGYVVVRDRFSPNWYELPYRRFTVPWRGGRMATPWYRRERP